MSLTSDLTAFSVTSVGRRHVVGLGPLSPRSRSGILEDVLVAVEVVDLVSKVTMRLLCCCADV